MEIDVPVDVDEAAAAADKIACFGIVDNSGWGGDRGEADGIGGFDLLDVAVDLGRRPRSRVEPVLEDELAAPLGQPVLGAHELADGGLGDELDLLDAGRRQPALDHLPGGCRLDRLGA